MRLSIAEAVNTDSRQEDARGYRVDFFLRVGSAGKLNEQSVPPCLDWSTISGVNYPHLWCQHSNRGSKCQHVAV